MTVRGIWTHGKIHDISTIGAGLKLETLKLHEHISQGVLFNCTARIEADPNNGELVTMGNATEQGLIKFLWKSNSVDAPKMLR